jgi:membrane fusion protein (multidrug efflux system)
MSGLLFIAGFDMTTPTKLIFFILLTTSLAGCGRADKQGGGPGVTGGGMPPPEVDVMTAMAGNVTVTKDLPGRLQAYRTAEVRARVEGVIEKRLFREGSDVTAGQSLFQIDPRIYQSAAASAKANLSVARQNLERYETLLKMKMVSQQAYDQAEAQVLQAQAALTRAREDLENASVPAAISGHIGRALVTEGALVGKGEPTLLATIEQIDPIYANFTQSGGDLLRLKQAIKTGTLKRDKSAKVELMLEDGSIYPHTGNIFFTDLAVDPGTGSVSLRAQFPNPKHDLLPGMFVRVRFPEAVTENAISIPQRAVLAGPQGQFVMVVGAENKVIPTPVTTGSMAGSDFIIEEGLKGGEQIIINGLQKVRPGSVVNPVFLPEAGKTAAANSAPSSKP